MSNRANLPAVNELERMQLAADSDAGMQRMLKFVKGKYRIGDDEVPVGTTFIAHPIGWTKCWIKFEDQQFIERKMYRVAEGARVPDRDELGDMDSSQWGPGMSGPHSDPWSMQYLLPLEDPETGEVVVFVTGSVGGRRAVAGLCGIYARRKSRDRAIGSPKIGLFVGEMPTSQYGKVPCPILKLQGWTTGGEEVREVTGEVSSPGDMDDEIPF